MKFQIIPAYQAANVALVGNVLGIEVTVRALEKQCNLGNIDHHREGDTSETPSACEQMFAWYKGQGVRMAEMPETVVGVIADADTITAMAILRLAKWGDEYRAETGFPSDFKINPVTVGAIGLIDRKGPASCQDEMNIPVIKAIRAICTRRELTCEQQVISVAHLLTRDNMYRLNLTEQDYVNEADEQANKIRNNSIIKKLENGVVYVESSDFGATQLGYEYGDIVLAFNPKMPKDFKDPSKGSYKKWTICKRDEHVKAVIDYNKLNELEGKDSKWGGRTTIGGSPQGVDSDLTLDQVLNCIKVG